MRLITRKVWRAFPALDQYDDAACARCVNRVWNGLLSNQFWLIVLAVLPISCIVWLGIMISVAIIFDLKVYPNISLVLHLMYSGFVVFPLISTLLVRDRWLAKVLVAEIDGVTCRVCQYCLVGSRIDALEDGTESVRCPECGTRHAVDDRLIARVDIEKQVAVINPATPADA